VDEVDAGHHLEQFSGYMGGGPNTVRREIDPAWIGPGVGNEFSDRLGGNTWIDFHHIGRAHDAGDGRNVPDEIEIEIEPVVKRCADRIIRPDQEKRIAVRRCADDYFGANIATCARSGFDDKGLTSCSHWPIRRERMSVVPPAAKAKTTRTGRVG